MKTTDFDFELPPELIAQAPLPERSASRLLVVPPGAAPLVDAGIRDLPGLLRAGDLLVFNDTRVIPARLFGRKPSGGRVEVLIERLLDERRALAQVGASKTPRTGATIELDGGGHARVLGRDADFFELRFEVDGDFDAWLRRAGRMPLPPYIRRDPAAADEERYQTVFARSEGAVAAPTAGLHFDQALLQALARAGIGSAHLTLHVGAGTFQPVRVEDIASHRMHAERYAVSQALVDAIAATRVAGGRVVAVGTTVVRALESAVQAGAGQLRAGEGDTRIFITPGHRFGAIDGLLTNFHLPRSTLLMLVSAFAGRERILAAYAHAVRQRYRFFSYGDAMLLWPQAVE